MNRVLTYWSFDWTSLAVLMMLTAFIIVSKSFGKKTILSSIAALFILCFVSPLKILSSHYLFSAHMMVHVWLLLALGPLLIMSLSSNAERFHSFFLFLKKYPVIGWLTGLGMMWFWHVPVLFNAAMSTHHHSLDLISIAESLSLITAGVCFSAPVIHPNREYRVDALSGVVYLFTACIGCSLLGLLITFAPQGTYHHFLSMSDEYGLNKIIVQQWQITQSADQQAAGLIMWVPCCLIYVGAAMYLLTQWFKQKDETVAYSNKL